MKIGEYLIAKKYAIKPIKCGDGVVGSFEVKKGEKFYISDINDTLKQIEIDYHNQKIWFSISNDESYFTEDYHTYFYDINKSRRKIKLQKINESI